MTRVAIIGGDDRMRGLDWGSDYRLFTGDDSGRLVKAAREGSIRGVIALSKWMHGALKNGLRSLPKEIKVVFYPKSIASLGTELEQIVAENFPPPAPPVSAVKPQPTFRPTIGDVVKLSEAVKAVVARPFSESDDRKLRSIVNRDGADNLAERFEALTGQKREQKELEERYLTMPLLHQLQPKHGEAMVSAAKVLSDGLPHMPSEAYGAPAQGLGAIAQIFQSVFGDSVAMTGAKISRRMQVADWAKFREKAATLGVDLPEQAPAIAVEPQRPATVEEPQPTREAAPDDLRDAIAALTEAVATVVEVVSAISGKLDALSGSVAALKLRGGV